jgi:hypothetical protein
LASIGRAVAGSRQNQWLERIGITGCLAPESAVPSDNSVFHLRFSSWYSMWRFLSAAIVIIVSDPESKS